MTACKIEKQHIPVLPHTELLSSYITKKAFPRLAFPIREIF
uniref:Uncharacterized protein n=1 Tax=Anguilla anguilla TaxID=7936 RepID=A0A0E9VA82_ANGAN